MKYYFYRPCSTTSFSRPFDVWLTLTDFTGFFWKRQQYSLLGKVSLDTCPFILGYIAKYPWILFPDFVIAYPKNLH